MTTSRSDGLAYYHDFLSPLATPDLQLLEDLTAARDKAAGHEQRLQINELIMRHTQGAFDASKEESDEWAASADGQDAMRLLTRDHPQADHPQRADHPQIGRLALRVEGEFWNAYYAMPDTMQDAVLLGSIRLDFVVSDIRKAAFMALMKDAVSDIIEEKFGERPGWNTPKKAPERDRTRSE